MTRTVVVVCFLIAFAAGLVVGMETRRDVAAPKGSRPDRHSGWLAAKLNLTAEQQEQLHAIWSDTAWRGGREREDRRRQLLRERDEAIAALIPAEDKPRYEAVLQEYAEKTAALDHAWRSSFQAAVERTKEILTPEQRVKYEELLNQHQSERKHWERRRGGDRKDGHRGDPHARASRGLKLCAAHKMSSRVVSEGG